MRAWIARVTLVVVVEFLSQDLIKECGLSEKEIIDGLTKIGAPSTKSGERIIIELTPNRPDLFFITGISRALGSYYKSEIRKYGTKKGPYKVIVDPSVGAVRPYTLCAVVKGLNLGQQKIEDLIQAQEKLMATIGRKTKKFGMGFYPLGGLTFPIRYTMMNLKDVRYKPLNYPTVADGFEILERHPKGQENRWILGDRKDYPVFLEGSGKVICLIPIVNSDEFGHVDEKTKDFFVEVTGIDLNIVKQVLSLVVCNLIDMGGTAYSVEMQYHDKKFQSIDLEEGKMGLDLKFINKILGLELTREKVAQLLKRMGYELSGANVLVPPYRLDVMHFVDIVEDVAIAYGYDKLEPEVPRVYSEGKLADYEGQSVADLMRGMGFYEVKMPILTSEEKIAFFGLNGERTENPGSIECGVIRPMLFLSLVDVFVNNKMAGQPQKIYEIGVVYTERGQKKHLGFGVGDEKLEYSKAKSYLQTLLKEMGVEYKIENGSFAGFDKEKNCKVLIDGREAGVFGLLSENARERLGLKNNIYFCELELPLR